MGKTPGFPIKNVGNDKGGFVAPLLVQLSFPQSLAGIQSFLLSLHSSSPAWEKPLDSRWKTSGMTEGGCQWPVVSAQLPVPVAGAHWPLTTNH